MRVELRVVMEVSPVEIYYELRGHQIHEVLAVNLKEAVMDLEIRGVNIANVQVNHYYAEAQVEESGV